MNDLNVNNRYAVILCGGSGTRLWPLSRTMRPKQLLALNGKQSLLQQTAARVAKHITPKHLFTVTHDDHKFEIKGQLADSWSEALPNVLAEPCARNTLPAIAWAAYQIYLKNQNAIIGVFASDHAIDNEEAFLKAWQAAETIANKDYLVLLGIEANYPATGYGYIKPANKITDQNEYSTYEVAQFIEKPDETRAKEFVKDGYFWNSGMFVFKASMLMQMLGKYQPEIYKIITTIDAESLVSEYAKLPNISMDYGLAEVLVKHTEKVAVVPVDMNWSDLGSWDSIYERNNKDLNGNVLRGNAASIDTTNSLVWSDHGLLATLGVDNLVVVQTADATLVCDKSRSEDIKTLVNEIKTHKPALTEIHQTVHRPWGTYTTLEEGDRFKIKRIVVKPSGRLSLQMHHHRSEHWVVVSGIAKVTNGDKIFFVSPNESTFIPAGCNHRLENPGVMDLIMIEVQSGDYVGEDDIVRFDDSYGRVGQ